MNFKPEKEEMIPTYGLARNATNATLMFTRLSHSASIVPIANVHINHSATTAPLANVHISHPASAAPLANVHINHPESAAPLANVHITLFLTAYVPARITSRHFSARVNPICFCGTQKLSGKKNKSRLLPADDRPSRNCHGPWVFTLLCSQPPRGFCITRSICCWA